MKIEQSIFVISIQSCKSTHKNQVTISVFILILLAAIGLIICKLLDMRGIYFLYVYIYIYKYISGQTFYFVTVLRESHNVYI